jgi:hypothetical protein
MIERLSRSADAVIGFKVTGRVGPDDYATMVPAIEAALKAHESSVEIIWSPTTTSPSGLRTEPRYWWGPPRVRCCDSMPVARRRQYTQRKNPGWSGGLG